jgi:hypothetical protein
MENRIDCENNTECLTAEPKKEIIKPYKISFYLERRTNYGTGK